MGPQMQEIKEYEETVPHNFQQPNKSQQMLSQDGTVYNWSAQVPHVPCICRPPLGLITITNKYQPHRRCGRLGRPSRNYGMRRCCRTMSSIRTEEYIRPMWLDKCWQVLWNWNDHNQNHGIALHHDTYQTYKGTDPITSLSFGRGGVLTLGTHIGRAPTKMLFQQDGDALVMAPGFQAEFCHGVPAVKPGGLGWSPPCMLHWRPGKKGP